MHVTGVQDCIELWELLSEIKMLSRLTVQTCTMEPFGKNDTCVQHSFLNASSEIYVFGIFAINLQK